LDAKEEDHKPYKVSLRTSVRSYRLLFASMFVAVCLDVFVCR